MAKRPDEELCKDATLAYARARGYQATATPGVREAPDYDATIDGAECALEVTMVMALRRWEALKRREHMSPRR
jgi:hypothetical protein